MELGTENVALNEPVVVVVTVVGEVVTVVPSYLIVIVEEAAYPVPVAVTVDPTVPLVGISPTDVVMLKVAEAEFDEVSPAVMVCAPFGEIGAMMDPAKEPTLDEVIVVGIVGWTVPSYLIEMLDEAANPVPDTVTVVPPTPVVGERVMDGMTVKVVWAACIPSDAATWCAPAIEGGITNDVENRPALSVVVDVIVVKSSVIVIPVNGRKLDPETVVDAPTAPDEGDRDTVGTATVSVVCPVRVPVPTSPVTVIVNVPPGVELELATVRGVVEGVDESEGKRIGLLNVTVVLPGAPVSVSRILPGRPVVVELGVSDTLTA